MALYWELYCPGWGINMPEIVSLAINPLGLAVTASALFLTGLILSPRKLVINRAVISSCVTTLIIQLFIAWGIVWVMGINGHLAVTAILMIALPGGFFGIVFGNQFGIQSPDSEATLLLTSVLCTVTLPLFIGLTSVV